MRIRPPRSPLSSNAEGPSLRERITALRYIPPFLKLVWQTSRQMTVAIVLLRLVRSFLPLAILWVGKLIIDTVVASRETSLDSARLWRLLLLELGLAFATELLSRLSSLVESLLGDLFSNRTSILLMQHAAKLDLYQFENPAFYDQLDRARRQTTGRIGLLAQLLMMGQDALTDPLERRAAGIQSMVVTTARHCDCPWLSRRSTLRVARVLTALSTYTGATQTRLHPLSRRERSACERNSDVRSCFLAD